MLSSVMACTRELMVANTVIMAAPPKNIIAEESASEVDRAKTMVTTPSRTSISSALKPSPLVLPRPATISAPHTEPPPEQYSNCVNVDVPPCRTSLANTGKNVISGIPNIVIRNDSTMSGFMPSCTRMKAMPSFMLASTAPLDFAGMNPTLMTYKVTITATNEIPFNPKHQSAPSFASATPPSTGPMIRARLNWIEFSAMALGRSSFGTSDGISAEYAGPPKLCAMPTVNDRRSEEHTS